MKDSRLVHMVIVLSFHNFSKVSINKDEAFVSSENTFLLKLSAKYFALTDQVT